MSSNFDSAYLRILGTESSEFGTLQPEGLPNITGTVSTQGNVKNPNTATGAFKSLKLGEIDSGYSNSYHYINLAGFDASNGETRTDGTVKTDEDYKIYGSSNHVTPKSHAIKIWKRIS